VPRTPLVVLALAIAAVTASACADPTVTYHPAAHASATAAVTSAHPSPSPHRPAPSPSASKPPALAQTWGNKSGHAAIPAAARPVATTHPDHVIGTGTPASCTSAAVVAAVARGGVITFNCGPNPVTITMTATAKVVNTHPTIVIDGGGLVTLSGGGTRRILYMDTCDPAQHWTTNHCQDQSTPSLTVQNLTFTDGNATGQLSEGGGGGAILVRGGRFKVINSRFTDNRCDSTGPDLGGAAIRVLSQYHNQPVYIVDSTFTGGRCSNGGALSSIGVTWQVLNCVMTGNDAIGTGANPAKTGTPGGGSGGAIYTDGNTYTVTVAGTIIENNTANEGGGAIFFVSNDHTGSLTVSSSTLKRNHSGQFQNYPGIFFLGRSHTFTNSTVA
jgi:hypothetical protein